MGWFSLLKSRNAAINIALFSATGVLCYLYSAWFLFLPVAFHAINDLLHWSIGWSVFNTEELISSGYCGVHDFLSNQIDDGLDLGFNFYEGDFSRHRKEAQKAKWDYVLNQLGLKPGHKLLDVGCGYGDWLNYARQKGVIVKGINLTEVQAKTAKEKYGLDVLNINWKEVLTNPALQKELYGQFDAVTFMDTIEHYVPPTSRRNQALQQKIYTDVFKFAHNLLNPKSDLGRVFISCLHQVRQKWTFLEAASVWVLNRTQSGFYPINDDGLTKHSTPFFKEVTRVDKTEDYRMTAILEPEHFQTNKNLKVNLQLVCKGFLWFFLDPYLVHRLIALPLDHWMRLYGADRHERKYDPEKRAKTSVVRHWMITLERLH